MTDTEAADHEIIVVGAGFAGIGVAIKLHQAGFTDYLILDDADGAGGTWHWNTYPGVAVDILSYSYQFSFEQRSNWSRSYAPGAELKAYAEHCVDKYQLRSRIRFGTIIVSAVFDEASTLWRLRTSTGEQLTATYLVGATGALTRPKVPDIAGLPDFGGVIMHTARWNHDHTLRGTRVGIIGTGASAVQVIPAIAPDVDTLTVFQRTPIWCLPKLDIAIPPTARLLLSRIPGSRSAARLASQAFVEATFPIAAHYHTPLKMGVLGEKIGRAHLRRQVRDPIVRDHLTPRYGLGCKRPSFHNTYLATFNRANVALETNPITHISAHGIHTADGATHNIDALILATGFKVMESGNMPTFTLTGRRGVVLEDWWNTNRLQAYEGVTVPGFPNFFTIMGPYGYNGSSYFNLIEAQSTHILRCLKHARNRRSQYVEVTREANDRYFAEMLSRQHRQIFWQDSCATARSYYFDKHGDVPLRPTTTLEAAWRSSRFNLDDYTFTGSTPNLV